LYAEQQNMAAGARPVIRAHGLTKDLPLGKTVVHAVRGVNLEIYAGEIVGIIGPSGSGKSTLLGLIGGLDKPTGGIIEIDGVDISKLSEDRLTEIRNEKIGFVFQFFNLIPTLTALENVALPIQFARKRKFNSDKRAKELLSLLGMKDRLHHRPSELSGGQQQRVAIARALANNPPLLLADEPTGNLDSESGEIVLQALEHVRQETGTTVVVVTHDVSIARRTGRILRLIDGQLFDAPAKAAHA
jgi:putative ABC transport system ATP-binding protein